MIENFSLMPIKTPLKEVISVTLGSFGFKETTIIVRHILIKILTGRITNLAPNRGEASKNEPILKLANKNCAISSKRFCKFSMEIFRQRNYLEGKWTQ